MLREAEFVAEDALGPISEEDRADLALVRGALVGYLDRNIAAARAEGDDLSVAEVIYRFLEALGGSDPAEPQILRAVDAFQDAMASRLTSCDERMARDLSRVVLAKCFVNILEQLDTRLLFDRIREFEAAARQVGRLREDLKVYLGRAARLVLVCDDQQRLAPLVDVEEVLQAWWALLESLTALAGLAEAHRSPEELLLEDGSHRRRHRPPREPPPAAYCRSHPLQRHAPPCRALVANHQTERRQFLPSGPGGALKR